MRHAAKAKTTREGNGSGASGTARNDTKEITRSNSSQSKQNVIPFEVIGRVWALYSDIVFANAGDRDNYEAVKQKRANRDGEISGMRSYASSH